VRVIGNTKVVPLSSNAATTDLPPMVDVQEAFRCDKRKNWDSVSSYALRGSFGGLAVAGSLREQREVCLWVMRQRDRFGRDNIV
jgi:hypothetical protein